MSGHNLFLLTSNLFYLNLAQLPKTLLNSPAGLLPTGHLSTSHSFFRSLAKLFHLSTLVAFEFRLIGVSAIASKDFWSQNCNGFFNFLKSATNSKSY